MATNLALDDALIASAQSLGHHRTKREAVTVALETYIQNLRQQEMLDVFGTVEYLPDYDYKQQRQQN
jgi:Arc/MetJ family transcription regulator